MRGILLVTAALVAFGLTAAGSFHFDDYALFSDPAITSPDGWLEVWRPVQTRPLTYFTFWLNYQADGANPLGYHLVNLALHIAISLFLLAVLVHWLPPRAAWVAALLFAVHPIQTEPIAYVFARATLLATLFSLVSLWLWAKGWRWMAVAAFAVALLAKEECVALPILLLALWLASNEGVRGLKADLAKLAPIAAMLLLALAAGARVIWATTVTHGSGAAAGAGISPLVYGSFQGVAILRYLAMLVVPWGFTVDPDIAVSPWLRALAWVAVAGMTAVAAWRWRGLRAGFWFIAGLLLLAPSSSIFPAADLAADRRMYLPMIAFSACAALLIAHWPPKALAVMMFTLAGVSVGYSWIWHSEQSLWTEAIHRAPTKIRPKIWLSRSVEPHQALAVLEDARKISPDDAAVAAEQGRVWLELGRPADALTAFGRALAITPGDAGAINNRGVALDLLGQRDAAKQDFEHALALNPCLFNARLNVQRLGARPPAANCRFTPDQAAQLR